MENLEEYQIDEWFDNPVTEYFAELITKNCTEEFRKRAETYFQGEPTRTHEQKTYFLGREQVFEDLESCFEERSLEVLEVEEVDGELIRYLPTRRPSSSKARGAGEEDSGGDSDSRPSHRSAFSRAVDWLRGSSRS